MPPRLMILSTALVLACTSKDEGMPGTSDSGDSGTVTPVDTDGDGIVDEEDCAPADPSVYPGALEICNDVDDDCNGTVDDNASDAGTWYADADGDGFGAPAASVDACGSPDGHVDDGSDCDDTNPDAPADDGDCDGVPTGQDCDDDDSNVGRGEPDDLDCDGIPTHAGGGVLRRIAASSFDVGCTSGQSRCEANESPVMPVTLTHDYYIGETEVTQAQYVALTEINPSYAASCGEQCPVEQVTWHMAAAYTNLLSTFAGLSECYICTGIIPSIDCTAALSPYDCEGYRLPTEAEWEGAARCGSDRRYAGSDVVADVGWYRDNSGGSPHAVGGLATNDCGLYDMSGNAAEWIHDWYANDGYTAAGRTDPEGPEAGDFRVVRGGHWYDSDTFLRVAYRPGNSPTTSEPYVGFRVARTIP